MVMMQTRPGASAPCADSVAAMDRFLQAVERLHGGHGRVPRGGGGRGGVAAGTATRPPGVRDRRAAEIETAVWVMRPGSRRLLPSKVGQGGAGSLLGLHDSQGSAVAQMLSARSYAVTMVSLQQYSCRHPRLGLI